MGVKNWPKGDYVICEGSLKTNFDCSDNTDNRHRPKGAYRLVWGLVKGITESTITIMYLDELHPGDSFLYHLQNIGNIICYKNRLLD